jgi:hypothetical protein
MAKQKSKIPRRLRMDRESRLQSSRAWICQHNGKNIVRGYSKWFGVDRLCAITELQILGIKIDPEYIDSVKATIANKISDKARKRLKKENITPIGEFIESDENFPYIAWYTDSGAPFGVRLEE